MKIYKPPILITGCARSGTSMTSGIIHMCGAFGGVFVPPTINNKKGFFENKEIREKITKAHLSSIGADPRGQHPLPSDEKIYNYSKEYSDKFRNRIMEVMIRQGLKEEQIWFYKGVKMCLFWPLWDSAFPTATWIIVRRDSNDIVNSCLRTGFMNAFNTAEKWKVWVGKYIDRFEEMKGAGLKIYEVWPQKIINGDLQEIKELIFNLGLKWNERVEADFITPSLWKGGTVNEKMEAGF